MKKITTTTILFFTLYSTVWSMISNHKVRPPFKTVSYDTSNVLDVLKTKDPTNYMHVLPTRIRRYLKIFVTHEVDEAKTLHEALERTQYYCGKNPKLAGHLIAKQFSKDEISKMLSLLAGLFIEPPNKKNLAINEQRLIDRFTTLLYAGADPNKPGPKGTCSLFEATLYRRHTIVHYLLCHKDIDPNANAQQWPVRPLAIAIQLSDSTFIAWLVNAGAGINLGITKSFFRDDEGDETPLMLACRGSSPSTVEQLLKTPGICVNARLFDGSTALHTAALGEGHKKKIKLLLEYGADPRLTDRKDQKPIDCTRNEEIKKMLCEAETSLSNRN